MSRGTVSGNGIVTDGLVLSLDAANPKSYVSGSTVWRDLSANNYTANLINGPTFNSVNGGSIQFDGIDDFITGSNSSNFAFGTGNFTVDVWGYMNTTLAVFVDLRTNPLGTGPGYSDYILNNKFNLYWSNLTRYTSTTNINTATWNNITVTRSSSTIFVYINSILDGTFSDSTNLTEGGFRLSRNVNIGSGTFYSNSKISNLKLYNRALSASEVLQNYNATKTRFGL